MEFFLCGFGRVSFVPDRQELLLSVILPFQVFGFAATIVFAIDFYITFNDLVTFLKQGSSDSPEGRKTEGGWNSCLLNELQCETSLPNSPFAGSKSSCSVRAVSILGLVCDSCAQLGSCKWNSSDL